MVDTNQILDATIEALRAAAEPRFFRTERAYHGRFYCALQASLDRRDLLRDGAILEMEYQKSARHRTTQRPDIVFHRPAEESRSAVTSNNFAVYALKRRATRLAARADFAKLHEMCEQLDYALAVFVRIDSEATLREEYTGAFQDRIHAFGVLGADGQVTVVGS